MGTKCGRCDYFDDCKKTLKNKSDNIDDFSIELIPYIKKSIVEQLNNKDIHTIGELKDNIEGIKFNDSPDPLFPEVPILSLKAKSLSKNEEILPQSMYSAKIPKFTDIVMVINSELDPLYDRVYAMAFSLNIFVGKKSPYSQEFNEWWEIWRNYLNLLL